MMQGYFLRTILILAMGAFSLSAENDQYSDRFIYPASSQTFFVKPSTSLQNVVKKQITFLAYIAGDNSLASCVQADLKEMMRVGSNQNMNVLAAVHTKQPGKSKTSNHYLVMPAKLVPQGILPAMDSGKADTVIKAVDWAIKNFPSDMFIIVFWDHGSGAFNRTPACMRACCYDDSTGSFLTDASLQQILAHAQKLRGGKKTDVVAFDACLMADVEVAYALAPYADYLVASQETIPGEGYGYDQVLMRPAQGKITARQFAMNAVAAYETVYHGVVSNYTLSAIDLSKIGRVVSNSNALVMQLSNALNGPDAHAFINALKISRDEKHCTHFEAEGHLDIIHFYSNLLGEVQKISVSKPKAYDALIKIIQDGIRIVSGAIATRVHGDDYPLAHGLSLYFPGDVLDSTYPTTAWGQKTNWVGFINQYLTATVGM